MIKYALVPPKYKDKMNPQYLYWKSCLPFVENRLGVLIHRPKRVHTLVAHHGFRNLAIETWCGNSQNGMDKFTFLSAPPDGKVVCARCEMMAIENGLLSSDDIVGRHVHIGHVKPVITCHPKLNNEEIS